MNKKKVIAIIQARMGSTRLPGKMMMPLSGKPLLWHVFERARKIKNVSEIVLATTTEDRDTVLADLAEEMGVKIFRGSETDVLERFIGAGEKFEAEGIVRICADAPLIEPSEIDKLVQAAVESDCEGAYVDVSVPTAVSSFEYATFDALKRVCAATDDKYVHEHVTVYLRTEPNFAKVIYIKPDSKFNIANFKSAIDTQDDYEFWKNIYSKFYREGEIIDLTEVVNSLK